MSAIRLCRPPGNHKIFRQDEFCNIQTWVYSAQIRWFKIRLWMGCRVHIFFNDFHCRNKVSLRQILAWHNTLATRRRHAVQISHQTPNISNNFIQIKCWQQHLTQIEKQKYLQLFSAISFWKAGTNCLQTGSGEADYMSQNSLITPLLPWYRPLLQGGLHLG